MDFLKDMVAGLRRVFTATRLAFLWSIRWELLLGLGGLVATLKVIGWIRAADPTASPVDPGILSVLWLPLVLVGLALIAAWLVLNFAFPTVDDYADGDDDKEGSAVPFADRRSFRRDWRALAPLARVGVLFGVLGVVFVSFIAAGVALLA